MYTPVEASVIKSGTTSGQLGIGQPLGEVDHWLDIPSQVRLTIGHPLVQPDIWLDVLTQERYLVVKSGTTSDQLDNWSPFGSG